MAPAMAIRVMDFAIMALRVMDSATMAFRITAIGITSMAIVLAPELKSLSVHR
jgi:hypothetical protein